MANDDVIVLNAGYSALEQRTSKTGKQRFTIRVKSEPLAFNLDPKSLGAPITAAIIHHLKERIKGISATASPARLRARKVAQKAAQAGASWATKLYSGGRIGAMPPNQSDRAFNDSGRFAESVSGSASSDGSWRINVASNRLDPKTGNIDRIWKRLAELVPEFVNPALLMQNDIVRRGIENAQQNMIKKLDAAKSSNVIGIARELFKIGQNLSSLASG